MSEIASDQCADSPLRPDGAVGALERPPSFLAVPLAAAASVDVKLDASVTHQTIDGFGASEAFGFSPESSANCPRGRVTVVPETTTVPLRP